MVPLLLLSILAVSDLPLLAQGACPDSPAQTGKKVFCYYEGKKSPDQLEPCPCSHVLYKNVLVDSHSRVQLSAQQVSDLENLRASKPGLSVLLSLGGQAVTSNTFRAIVSRKDQLNNFTQSLNQLYQEKTIQGIELDWEWPLDSGDKKDKIKLIRYIRQVKLATGDENIKRRIVRSAEETTSFPSLEIADNTTPLATDDDNDDVDSDDMIVTTEWSPTR